MTEAFNTPPSLYNLESDSPWSYKGRFGRLAYLAWSLVSLVLGSFIVAAIMLFFLKSTSNLQLALFIYRILFVFFFGIQVVFAIRRFHDLNKSGWWAISVFIPLINIIFMFYMLLAKGTDGINRFGPQRPTPLWEKVVGWLGIFMMIAISVLAAFSIPAYQSYLKRAQVAQELSQSRAQSADEKTSAQNADNVAQAASAAADYSASGTEPVGTNSEATPTTAPTPQ